MKNETRQQAKNLFFQTNLSKSEIANLLNVNRRTIHVWAKEGDWERLRISGRHLPAIVAEHCYYLIGRLTTSILSESHGSVPPTLSEAQTIQKLATSINAIKNHSTVNESMEMFAFFLQELKKKDPAMAQSILPHIDDYISAQKGALTTAHLLDGFDQYFRLHDVQPDFEEQLLDKQTDAMLEEEEDNMAA